MLNILLVAHRFKLVIVMRLISLKIFYYISACHLLLSFKLPIGFRRVAFFNRPKFLEIVKLILNFEEITCLIIHKNWSRVVYELIVIIWKLPMPFLSFTLFGLLDGIPFSVERSILCHVNNSASTLEQFFLFHLSAYWFLRGFLAGRLILQSAAYSCSF